MHDMDQPCSQLKDNELFVREWFGTDYACSLCQAIPVSSEVKIYLPADKIRALDPTGFSAGHYGSPLQLKKEISSEPLHLAAEFWACAKDRKALEVQVAHTYRDSCHVIWRHAPTDRAIVVVPG